jgi:hypothetical protein
VNTSWAVSTFEPIYGPFLREAMRGAKRSNAFLDFLTDSGVSAASTRQLSDMMGTGMENAYEDEEHMF